MSETGREQTTVLSVESARKEFSIRGVGPGRRRLTAVDGVDLSVGRGETVALVGESGSGKSTLGRLMLGLDKPTAGRVLHHGDDLASMDRERWRQYRRAVQAVFQDTGSSLNPRHTIAESVALGLRHNRGMAERPALARARELLAEVDLDPEVFARRHPLELSGGQRQRVSIARAIASDPEVIVADEAVSALDVSVRAQVLKVFKRMQQENGVGYLFITHDLGVVRAISDRVVVMYLGRVVHVGPARPVMEDPAHPYTRALLDAAPVPDPAVRGRERIRLRGDLPSPVSPPSGCHFHTRCPLATERCRTESPELLPDPRHPGVLTACFHADRVPELAQRAGTTGGTDG